MITIKKKENGGYTMELEDGDFEILKMFYNEMCKAALNDNTQEERDRIAGLEYATKCYKAFVDAEGEAEDASEKS